VRAEAAWYFKQTADCPMRDVEKSSISPEIGGTSGILCLLGTS
jgi:hypothetical protein